VREIRGRGARVRCVNTASATRLVDHDDAAPTVTAAIQGADAPIPITRVRDRGRDRPRIIRNPHRRQPPARTVLTDNHRTLTMKVNPDLPSTHRGLPPSQEETVREAPNLNRLEPHDERRPRSFTASVMARVGAMEP
jgi:hypothetical protein